ncbi:MAG: ribosome assembly cofactor RimP [Treponema sp.]|nr:ribosome assembly cofactor RimP [Treponema sp.]
MQYSAKTDKPCEAEQAALEEDIAALLKKLSLELIEFDVFKSKPRKGSAGTVHIRAVIYQRGSIGTDECSQAHRTILPRLELAFSGHDISLEVSSPGINRLIKDGIELSRYLGRGVRVWRTDIADWSEGVIDASDEQGITIKGRKGLIRLDYAIIAKARLDSTQEEYIGH